MKAHGPGPEREIVENETNRRAGTAYETLDCDGRLELLAGLGALAG